MRNQREWETKKDSGAWDRVSGERGDKGLYEGEEVSGERVCKISWQVGLAKKREEKRERKEKKGRKIKDLEAGKFRF